MTEAEKTEIINAVISALNDDSTNYDDKVVEPYADDIVLIMRKEGDTRVGRCVTWEGIIETLTAAAKSFAEASERSASTAEEAKQTAVSAIEAIELAKTDIDNKHESVVQAALSANNSAESAASSASSASSDREAVKSMKAAAETAKSGAEDANTKAQEALTKTTNAKNEVIQAKEDTSAMKSNVEKTISDFNASICRWVYRDNRIYLTIGEN